ncbi:MAG: glycosyltransferase family 39 protein [Anaerolineae bacterium]|nr:glycosyltransferase family 39 protein [Anaerolineae bacterium]
MKNSNLIILGASAILLPLLVLVVSWYPWQLSAGLLLIAFLPGYALLLALRPQSEHLTQPEQWLIAVPISYSLTTILLLLMALARLPLNTLSVGFGLGGLTLLFALIAWRREAAYQRMANDPKPERFSSLPTRRFAYSVILILLLAACFRVINIHYSDYQGDEADILLRAVSLVYGQGDALLTHSKGPGEILLLNAIGTLTGRFDEQTARLPFAVAGTIAVGLIALLGQRLFNPWVGLIAGLLAAVDGVFVSYARTAQYQSVVLLLTLTAIYGYYRFYQTGSQSRHWHSLATFLLAAACLFHFETILLLPVAAYLTFASALPGSREEAKQRGAEERSVLQLLRLTHHVSRIMYHVSRFWPSLLLFIVPVALFYIPFALNPNLKSTGTYLENRIGGGSSPPFNNLAHFFYYEALKYNSAYYVALFDGLLLLLVIVALAEMQRNTPVNYRGQAGREENSRLRSPRLALCAGSPLLPRLLIALLLLSGSVLWLLGWVQLAAGLLAVGLALFFGWVIPSPQTDMPQRILWLWLAPPFWVYVFLVNRPGKHHYLFLGALTLWVGWMVVQLWHWSVSRWPGLRQPAGRWLAAAAAAGLLAIFAGHALMLFLRSNVEYVLTYPEHKSNFYPTDAAYPYGTRIGFGYPFRLGWQLVGQLRRTGQLEGSWAGNDDGNAPLWYMLGDPSTPCYPRYVLEGKITYKGDSDFNVPFDPANFGYSPRYRLWGNGRLRLTISEFQPLHPADVIDLVEPAYFEPPVTAADFAPALMAKPAAPQALLEPPLVLGEGSELKNNAPPEYLERAGQLAGRVALLGYDINQDYARPGGIVPITLYWQAQSLLSLRYKVFIHLLSSQEEGQAEVVAQADDFPVCGLSHANTWTPGETVLDRHLLKLPPDLPPGDYTLLAGMYEPDLNLRLNYLDIAGNEQGNSLTIGTLSVKPDSSRE